MLIECKDCGAKLNGEVKLWEHRREAHLISSLLDEVVQIKLRLETDTRNLARARLELEEALKARRDNAIDPKVQPGLQRWLASDKHDKHGRVIK